MAKINSLVILQETGVSASKSSSTLNEDDFVMFGNEEPPGHNAHSDEMLTIFGLRNEILVACTSGLLPLTASFPLTRCNSVFLLALESAPNLWQGLCFWELRLFFVIALQEHHH